MVSRNKKIRAKVSQILKKRHFMPPNTTNTASKAFDASGYSLEAEAGVLGSILIDKEAIIPDLKPSDFYDTRNEFIFKAIVDLDEERTEIDMLTVAAKLESDKKLKLAGGKGRICEITEETPTSSHLKSYTKIVKQKSIIRAVRRAGREIALLDDPKKADAILGKAISKIHDKNPNDVLDLIDIYNDSISRKEELKEKYGSVGLITGYKRVDRDICFERGQLITLAAKTSVGKSALGVNFGLGAASKGQSVLYFSLEMPEPQLLDRVFSGMSKGAVGKEIGVRDFKHLKVGKEDLDKIMEKFITLEKFRMLSQAAISSRGIVNHCKRIKKNHGLDFVIVDYLQIMGDQAEKGESETNRLARITGNLKNIALELDVVVLLLSQFSREGTEINNLRGSGSIEQDSDTVLVIDRDKNRPDGYLTVKKARSDAMVSIPIIFNSSTTTYREMPETPGEIIARETEKMFS